MSVESSHTTNYPREITQNLKWAFGVMIDEGVHKGAHGSRVVGARAWGSRAIGGSAWFSACAFSESGAVLPTTVPGDDGKALATETFAGMKRRKQRMNSWGFPLKLAGNRWSDTCMVVP